MAVTQTSNSPGEMPAAVASLSPAQRAGLKRTLRRRGVRWGIWRLLALPLYADALLVGLLVEAHEILASISWLWPFYLALLFVVASLAVWGAVVLALGLVDAFRGQPLVLAGEVLRKPRVTSKAEWLLSMLEAFPNTFLDVESAVRIGPTGQVDRAGPEWSGVREIKCWGRVVRRLEEGEDVALLCTANGRALLRLDQGAYTWRSRRDTR